MKLSIYTFVKDGLYFDFHIVEMLKQHLPLADEIIVNEGYSTDGTYEAIKDLDPKIKVVRNRWDDSDPKSWSRKFKNQARQLCTGDWCILLDSDEFIPEWEFERLRSFLEQTDKVILPVRFLHFYANYRVYKVRETMSRAPWLGQRIHRNLDTVEVWGDGANVRIQDVPFEQPLEEFSFECHHFGGVRNPARLRHKWRIQAKRNAEQKASWDKTPSVLFNLFPHRWDDPDILPDVDIYDGPQIQSVRENPDEFVRDDLFLYNLLCEQRAKGRVS